MNSKARRNVKGPSMSYLTHLIRQSDEEHYMSQTINILMSDVRRCRQYLYIVIVLLSARTLIAILSVLSYNPATDRLNTAASVLDITLTASWWLVIQRLMHGEALIRGYEPRFTPPQPWRSLFVAKALFVLALLLLPFVLSDCVILQAAGFSVMKLLPNFLLRCIFLGDALILTPFVLASITSNQRQFLISCLLLMLVLIVALFLTALHPVNPVAGALESYSQGRKPELQVWRVCMFYSVVCSGLLVWQFARRQTQKVRITFLILVAVALAPPAHLPSHQTLEPTSDSYPSIGIRLLNRPKATKCQVHVVENTTQVDVPIELSGWSRELLEPELAYAIIKTDSGVTWRTAWSPHNNITKGPDDWLELHIDNKEFKRLIRQPVTIDAILGIIVYERYAVFKLPDSRRFVTIPQVGSIEVIRQMGVPLLFRRTPLWETTDGYMCNLPTSDPDWTLVDVHHGAYPSESVQVFTFSPVVSFVEPFERRHAAIAAMGKADITLLRPVCLRRSLHLPGVRLADYTASAF